MTGEKIHINLEEGLKRVMNNGKLYAKLLGKFKTDASFADLAEQITAGDLEKAQVSVHTLKGLAANLSLTWLFERTLDLENQIKERALREDALEELKNVYEETLKKADEVIAKYAT
jgi:HPt (histidine-containing phosphotransfer) domain-containing protein